MMSTNRKFALIGFETLTNGHAEYEALTTFSKRGLFVLLVNINTNQCLLSLPMMPRVMLSGTNE